MPIIAISVAVSLCRVTDNRSFVTCHLSSAFLHHQHIILFGRWSVQHASCYAAVSEEEEEEEEEKEAKGEEEEDFRINSNVLARELIPFAVFESARVKPN